ncbi:MAG: gamma-glutamylcyclotransferase family protein [Actinomycetota bacterium]
MKIGNAPVATWVFGYGSLVSPESISRTIDRRPEFGVDVFVAHLDGYGRRWNYGSIVLRGDWSHNGANIEDGVVISLGVVAGEGERCNGVVFAVTADELAALDWRERDYRRVEVTAAVDHEAPADLVREVVLYVPSPDSIARYEDARDAGRAAIRQTYWDLVHDGFNSLGDAHGAMMRTTPLPDVPVVNIEMRPRPPGSRRT